MDFLKSDETAGKVSAGEVQAAETAARQAQEKLKLEGQAAAIRAEELALEEQLAQLRDKGLLSETGRAAIQERITELKKREAEYAANAGLQRGVEGRKDDLGAALSRGSLDFFTSAGLIDRKTGEFKTAAQEMAGYWQSAMSGMSTSMANVFQGLATGTIKGKDAFKSFATSILTDMAQIASKAASNEIMKALFGDLIGSAGGTSSGSGGLASLLGTFFSGPAAPGMATGGLVTGGTPNRDSVPRTLMPGEFVLKRSAVDVIGQDTLDRMNALGAGVVSKAPPVEAGRIGGGNASAQANVYVVSPDQAPIPGPNDIFHHVIDNIQRNGNLRTLIKNVAAGYG